MKKFISISFFTWLFVMFSYPLFVEAAMPERKQLFDDNWRFKLGDTPDAPSLAYNDVGWRSLDLPHDWSVEADFDAEVPAGNDGGYLPTGIGWYRKKFHVDKVMEVRNCASILRVFI